MNEINKIQGLENGKGIQYLLDSANMIFRNPIYMIDSFINLIAASEGPMELSTWNELVTTGTFSLTLKLDIAQSGINEKLSALDRPVYVEKNSGVLDYGIITGKILNRSNEAIGELVMYEYYNTFEAETMAAFELLIGKITTEIVSYEYFTTLPSRYLELMVSKLLDMSTKSTSTYYAQPRIMRNHFERYLYLAVVQTVQNNVLAYVHRKRLEYYVSLLNARYTSYKATVYLGHIVMLMSSAYGDSREALLLDGEDNLFQYNGLYAGVSNSFESLYELSQYYDQANETLLNGRETARDTQIFYSDRR